MCIYLVRPDYAFFLDSNGKLVAVSDVSDWDEYQDRIVELSRSSITVEDVTYRSGPRFFLIKTCFIKEQNGEKEILYDAWKDMWFTFVEIAFVVITVPTILIVHFRSKREKAVFAINQNYIWKRRI